ncbi:MAG: hypothetical protein KBC73_10915 [Burkholderiaceae bacterium]|nr:hypothetical protein [Burkholderiaceae bacterium]
MRIRTGGALALGMVMMLAGPAQSAKGTGAVPLSPPTRAAFCGGDGHEDGLPRAAAVEINQAITRLRGQGLDVAQALQQLRRQHCGDGAAAPAGR